MMKRLSLPAICAMPALLVALGCTKASAPQPESEPRPESQPQPPAPQPGAKVTTARAPVIKGPPDMAAGVVAALPPPIPAPAPSAPPAEAAPVRLDPAGWNLVGPEVSLNGWSEIGPAEVARAPHRDTAVVFYQDGGHEPSVGSLWILDAPTGKIHYLAAWDWVFSADGTQVIIGANEGKIRKLPMVGGAALAPHGDQIVEKRVPEPWADDRDNGQPVKPRILDHGKARWRSLPASQLEAARQAFTHEYGVGSSWKEADDAMPGHVRITTRDEKLGMVLVEMPYKVQAFRRGP